MINRVQKLILLKNNNTDIDLSVPPTEIIDMVLIKNYRRALVQCNLFILLFLYSFANGQDEKKTINEAKSFKTLEQKEKEELITLLRDAANLVTGIRVQEALEKIISAEAIVNDYAPLYNLKGAAYTKIRDFDQAESSFKKALELDPKGVMTKFNLNEMLFVKKQYELAENGFKGFITNHKDLPTTTSSLVKYKILICHLKQDNLQEAELILNKYDFLDDVPVFYYGNAAIEFHKNNKNEANSWLIAANKIYKAEVNQVYRDSLIEADWIENIE